MKFKQFVENNIDDLFSTDDFSPVIKRETRTEPYTLKLYRGFTADLKELEQDNQFYFLSPKKSEQGMIWFTHQFINGYNPLDYAENHGSLLLTYPLQVKKHIQTNHQRNNKTWDSIPDYFAKLSCPTENCRFYAGMELPEGWVFSYKYEKFIGCQIKLKVPKNWVTPVNNS